jgi:hypothetical protein
MTTRKKPAFIRSVLVLSLAVGALALVARTPVLEAQGRSDLEARHQRLLPLFELSDVVYTDADEARGRLVVGVLNRGAEGRVRGRLRALGIDSQSVDVVETEPIFALATLRDWTSPLVGGLQIRFSQYLCSLGFIAENSKSEKGFVTASHCSDRQGAVDGTTYYQPLAPDENDWIGNEIADPPYVRGGACPKGKKCRQSDANFSLTSDARELNLGVIAQTTGGPGSLEISPTNPSFNIMGEGVATPGTAVDKVGRTTGWTRGNVTGTCVNTGVQGSTIVLICQTFVTNNGGVIVDSGDSGSPAFISLGNNNATLVGILWGGNQSGTQFVYSPMANIEAELGLLKTRP